MTSPELGNSHDQPPRLEELPSPSIRKHFPVARPEVIENLIDGGDDVLPYFPSPPAPTEQEVRDMEEAVLKAQRIIDRYGGKEDTFNRLCATYGTGTFEDLRFLHTIQEFYSRLADGTSLPDEEVEVYLETHVRPDFDQSIYGSILGQVAGWADSSAFPWAADYGGQLRAWQSNLPSEEREFSGSLSFTEEERHFWHEQLAPVFEPLVRDIDEGHAYSGFEMVELFRDGWERMRQQHGEDLLKDWNFKTWRPSTITNSGTRRTLFFGETVVRNSTTCRETFVHEMMHILQCQWGVEQGKYGPLVSYGLPDSNAFREATAREVGDVFRESRGVVMDYHLAIGMALGAGTEQPMDAKSIADSWYKAACLQYEQAKRAEGVELDTPDKKARVQAEARKHVIERFNRVFSLPERPEAVIKMIPTALETKYAAGAAEAVSELRKAREQIRAGSWDYFALLFCGKWTPSIPLDREVVMDYPTHPSRYARLFTAR